MKFNVNKIRGFTLVEIIISLAIFTVVAVVAIGALMKIIDANKKAQSIQNAITNLSFALESMSRELRTGSKFYCVDVFDANSIPTLNGYSGITASPCSFGASSSGIGKLIAFVSSEPATDYSGICTDGSGGRKAYNLVYAYRFVSNGATPPEYTLERAREKSTSCSSGAGISAADFQPVISVGNVKITGYEIGVMADNTNHKYPLATIRAAGYAGVGNRDKTYFDVQTSASARVP